MSSEYKSLARVFGLPLPKKVGDLQSWRSKLRSSYRVLAKRYHPDRGGDPQKFTMVTAAYNSLKTYEPTQNHVRPRSPVELPPKAVDVTKDPRTEARLRRLLLCGFTPEHRDVLSAMYASALSQRPHEPDFSWADRLACTYAKRYGYTTPWQLSDC